MRILQAGARTTLFTTMNLLVFWLLLTLSFLSPSSASAQTTNFNQYCFQYQTIHCFPSLSEAVNSLRTSFLTDHPEWAFLQPSDSYVLGDGRIALIYRVPDQAPEVIGSFGYAGLSGAYGTGVEELGECVPASYPSSGCSSEEAVVDRLIAGMTKYDTTDCYHSNFRIEGNYAEPYKTVGGSQTPPYEKGVISYGERILANDYFCNGQLIRIDETPLVKSQGFVCSSNFRVVVGLSSGELLNRWPTKQYCMVAEPPGMRSATIWKGLDQTASCSANSNPCHPATGDKSRTEPDFEFAGRTFFRNYHSLRQLPSALMPTGWRHSLEERVVSNDATNYLYINSDGSGELFTFSSSDSAEAASKKSTDLRLLRTPYQSTLGTKLLSSNGEIRSFDRRGYLLSITNASDPNRDIYISYEQTDIANDGKILSIKDSRGREAVFDYIGNRLRNIGLPDGQIVSYEVDANDSLVSASVAGLTRTYTYDVNPGLLTGIQGEDGVHFATFSYDGLDRVTSSTLQAGGVDVEKTTLSYPSNTTVLVNTDGKGSRTFEVSNSLYRNILSVTDSAGQYSTTYTPNTAFRSLTTDPLGNVSKYDYSNGRVSFRTDAKGSPYEERTSYSYNSAGQPTFIVEYNKVGFVYQQRRISTFAYDTRGAVLASCRLDGLVQGASSYSCGSLSNAPVGAQQVTFAYCSDQQAQSGICPIVGLLTSVDGQRVDVADTTTYTYYPSDDATCAATSTTCPHRKGDLWKVTNALGQVTETLAYDGAGRALSVKDANGVIMDMEYHPRGWLTARKIRGANASVETDDAITQIEYWPTGLVKKVIQPDGAFTAYTYDAAHRLTDIADNAGNTIHYTLDNAGNRTQEDTKDPGNVLKRTLSRVYNQLGQLQTQADAQANPTDFVYDANGNTDTVTDALGRVTDNNYDPLNRLSRTLQNVGGINAETKFAYDAQDNLTQVTDPKGLNTTYTYNGLGDLTQLASPDTGTTTYTYDSAGNRKTQTDARNQTSTYSYDALNRLTGIAYATSTLNVGYTYDTTQAACIAGETFSTGRLTQLADASGTTQYCYDRFGNLVRKVQTTNGIAFTVRYAYTLAGQLSSVTYPDGAIASYVRDAQGRTTQVNVQRAGAATEVLLNQASYHPFGPVAGWTYGNGRQLLRPLNQNYQPTAIQDTSAGGLSVGFAYDPVGNLTQLTPAASATPLVKFDYDALSRLTTFKDGPTDVAIESYAYDATGNRQSFTNSAGTQAYTYPSTNHRLTQVGTTVRSYDNAGNTTAIGGVAKEFVYDDTGRMSQVKQNAIVQRNYAYNGKGEQVRKYLGATNTYTLYDEAGHWLGDYDNTGAALQQAIWMDDLPVGLIANSNQLHYIEPDHLGTPRVVIEVARNVPVWTWDLKSEAFGNSVPNQDADGDANALVLDMRFPGQRYDAASGLNYNYFRDYDSGTGRYVSSDPIGLGGGPSTYAYSKSMPTGAYDPKGLTAIRLPPYGPGQQLPYGTIYCDDGVVTPFINWNRLPTYDQKCLGDCILAHEQSHVTDATRSNPGVCRYWGWVPFIYPKGTVGFDNRQERLASEFRAYAAELRCLAAKLAKEKCTSEMCQKVIEGRINDIVNAILPTVYNGTYPNGLPGSE